MLPKLHRFQRCRFVAVAACTFIVLPAVAQNSTNVGAMTPAAAQTQQEMNAAMDHLFRLKAAQGNGAEVLTGQLAVRKSTDREVRELAEMLVREHRMANTELFNLIRSKGMTPPREIGASHTAVYNQLNQLTGRDFDRIFMAGQVEMHEATITLFQQQIANGKDPETLAYARKYLPSILNHTAEIYALARKVGAPGIELRPATLTDNATAFGRMPHSR